VDDGATLLLMVRFYENLLGQREGLKGPLPRAQALAEARSWLRGLGRAEALRRLAGLTGGVVRGEEVEVPAEGPRRVLRLPAEEQPFAHPFFWAAFVLIGDPD
jgi:CHAT domain-containing protein